MCQIINRLAYARNLNYNQFLLEKFYKSNQLVATYLIEKESILFEHNGNKMTLFVQGDQFCIVCKFVFNNLAGKEYKAT